MVIDIFIFFLDINECDLLNGGCENGCNNTMGSFYCTCSDGFNLVNESFCEGKLL